MGSEINIRFKAQALGKSLENLAYEVQEELNQAIKDTANAAYASIVGSAQLGLHSTQKDYLKGLDFQQIGENSYLIVLEGDWANAIEKGFSGFDLKEWMLKSEKVVGIGSRTGEKWVQTGDEGEKYAHVPFQKQPFARAAASSDMNQAIRKLQAFNKQGRAQKFTSLFKDDKGRPLEGRVASVKNVEGFPELNGITKYQRKSKSESGKETLQSHYMVFRTISENGQGWMHPGYSGAHFFDEAEQWVDQQVDQILNTLLK